MNWVSLRSGLEIKPKFNDPVIPAWKPGSSAMDGTSIAREYLLLDSRHQWNDASLYYETTAPIRDRRVDRYAGTFFICWGDKILNMIVSSVP